MKKQPVKKTVSKSKAIVYPVNYDFGKFWGTTIVPFLDDPKIKASIIKGINMYLSHYPGKKKYDPEKPCPAMYSSLDWHCQLLDRKQRHLLKVLEKHKLLPQEYLDLRDNWTDDMPEEDAQRLFDLEQEIVSPYLYDWEETKHNMESYVLCLGCRSWAPTFELTLARLVEPDEKWRVREGKLHATVINENNTKVFDLIYWTLDGRAEEYTFGDPIPIPKRDPTMGGKLAWVNSSP